MAKYNGWKLGDAIGGGGQGQIFPAINSEFDDKEFILKKLTNKNRIDRFKDEIRAGTELDHPNIVKVIDYDYDSPHPFLVVEYYKNGDLGDYKLNNLSFEEKLNIYREILQAVAFAHQNGVIHRDLKPENIFLTDDLHPVIGDFGLCLFEDGERKTLTGENIGSRYYMAPENENGRYEDFTFASDVYSLGKILYFIVAEDIFNREDYKEPEFNIVRRAPKREYYLINEYFDKTIVKNPDNRISNACLALEEFQILLDRISMGANCIDPNVPQTCIYCGLGHYKIADSINIAGFPQKIADYYFKFSNHNWTFLICDHCNNIQIFLPMFVHSTDKWKKEEN